MFSTSEQLTRAAWALYQAQCAALNNFCHAACEAGVNALEINADAWRSSLASNTVVTRQWIGAGDANAWLTPAQQFEKVGQFALSALPASAPMFARPDAGSASFAAPA